MAALYCRRGRPSSMPDGYERSRVYGPCVRQLLLCESFNSFRLFFLVTHRGVEVKPQVRRHRVRPGTMETLRHLSGGKSASREHLVVVSSLMSPHSTRFGQTLELFLDSVTDSGYMRYSYAKPALTAVLNSGSILRYAFGCATRASPKSECLSALP